MKFRFATPPAAFVAHTQKIHQNVRNDREWCAMTFLRDSPNGFPVNREKRREIFPSG